MAGLASVVSATVSQGEAPSIIRSKRDRMGRTPGLNISTYIVRTGCQVQLNLGMHVVLPYLHVCMRARPPVHVCLVVAAAVWPRNSICKSTSMACVRLPGLPEQRAQEPGAHHQGSSLGIKVTAMRHLTCDACKW